MPVSSCQFPVVSFQLSVSSCQLLGVVGYAGRGESAGEPCPKAAIYCNLLQSGLRGLADCRDGLPKSWNLLQSTGMVQQGRFSAELFGMPRGD